MVEEQGIQIINVTKSYCRNDKRTIALNNVNLKIRPGEFVGVLGLNGSGKSTLARLLNGLIKPTSGKVLVNGMDTTSPSKVLEIRRQIGMVFQNPDNQIVCPLVEEEVAFGPENLGLPQAETQKRIDWALEVVGLSKYRKKAPHQLSGGQKQKVALASVLAMMPSYIVLDEPTSMLDPLSRRELLAHLKALNVEKGMTVILISHNPEDFIFTNRIIVLDKGSVSMEGTPGEVFRHKKKLAEIGLDPPEIYHTLIELATCGIIFDDATNNAEELVDEICQQLSTLSK